MHIVSETRISRKKYEINLLSLTWEGLQIVPLGKHSPKGFISVTIYPL